MAHSHVKDHTILFPTGKWFHNGGKGAGLTCQFLCFGGYKNCSLGWQQRQDQGKGSFVGELSFFVLLCIAFRGCVRVARTDVF